MPEYLAPGVYVEETSFRSKPIEGVSTSTTAFVGVTRTGPIFEAGETTGAPPLITNIGEFEQLYGRTGSLLGGQANYLAHAVRAYFQEGGSRLYISRVYARSAPAADGRSEAYLIGNAGTPDRARFRTRFAGASGDGDVVFREVEARATAARLRAADQGALLRVGTAVAAGPAGLDGGLLPLSVTDGAVLEVDVDGAGAQQLTFTSVAAEASAGQALAPGDTVLAEGSNSLTVTIDAGAAQLVTVPAGTYAREELVSALNARLVGGYVRLDGDTLVVGSDTRGAGSSVQVEVSASFGFDAQVSEEGEGVPDLGSVGVADINALLAADGTIAITATTTPDQTRLRLETAATGAARTLVVNVAAGTSAHTELGLTSGVTANGSAGETPVYYRRVGDQWLDATATALDVAGLTDEASLLSLALSFVNGDDIDETYEDLGFDPSHPRFIANLLPDQPTRRREVLQNKLGFRVDGAVTGFAIRTAIAGLPRRAIDLGDGDDSPKPALSLTGGSDGVAPGPADYRRALAALERVEDISIVAAPGSSAGLSPVTNQAVHAELISHVERRRAYRIAVLDAPEETTVGQAREVRSRIDTRYGALYYPWVAISNPDARANDPSIPQQIHVPPSGHVCGIYARNDVERGVHKAPANEVVRSAVGLEEDVSFGEQQVLNPEGINALRFFPGRGYRVWGARCATSDQEWKYVNIRRYFNFLEASIDRGTQWVVFEPNNERLWARVVESVSEFLYAQWRNGALMGLSPKEAYFVRCDRSTMTQNDFDAGRLVCEIGVAAAKPAEFVIFRIGQKTAEARS